VSHSVSLPTEQGRATTRTRARGRSRCGDSHRRAAPQHARESARGGDSHRRAALTHTLRQVESGLTLARASSLPVVQHAVIA
jgi:hypothetical protein